ncbi:F0F1 ATP synthase subunit B [Aurantimonas sp. C2-6-R+9]|uniref:ATP synthase subunit b n=2 Tax=root TaxID=1 RepID=A0A9C9NDB2_9HYPH|nr:MULTISPECIES: F0F1 ATP synthase subunit B [unclassified Aurantimonas]MEC5289059.1 F0F1 ATP synthase subunit B [Aurantimonas sp. C2-3-R2]MEC5379366.1 F0F1 ATP synthase subunit B [Aurantimonas sp. C2-6-R+9]MEC5410119.1 F0F1 ATP synthase subunit B [Aurantimonas sp. C2-4-R8]HDZ72568.1 F0F1 ATP synthase subunit B [Aurantimonas coralicida]HET99944.1 F0F1 ATP synthase subunit B [Aurantimonas coralicida]
MDNSFWAFVALVIFLALVWYLKAPTKVGKSLDDRAARIRNEIEEARELKEEAKQQLAEYQRRRQEAEQEAKDIVAAAKREATLLLEDANRKNEEYVARRTAMAETKIAQAEGDAVAEVRASAVNLAVAAAAKVLADRNSGSEAGRFIDESIGEVRKHLN